MKMPKLSSWFGRSAFSLELQSLFVIFGLFLFFRLGIGKTTKAQVSYPEF